MTLTSGTWALVTGASRGIGRRMALALADAGVNVAVQSRSLDGTADLLPLLTAAGVEAFAVAGELSDPGQVRALAAEVRARADVGLLYNNAGVQAPSADPYWLADAGQYVDTYLVNVVAPMILVEEFLPGMLERGFGRITNTTSGIADQPEQGAYAASKGALDKATLDLSARLRGTGVTANVSDPGWIRTDLGGPNAPGSVESTVPGMILGGFVPADLTGRWISAQDYTGLTLEEAVAAAEVKARYLAVTAPRP